MIPKKKLHFLQLTAIFFFITVAVLAYNWATNPARSSGMSMMGQSMGNMMRGMHAGNITIRNLFNQEERMEMSMGMSIPRSGASMHLTLSHYLSTMIIAFTLPLILAGGVFLLILWFK